MSSVYVTVLWFALAGSPDMIIASAYQTQEGCIAAANAHNKWAKTYPYENKILVLCEETRVQK